ncbi:putative ABC transporter ATP-binding protein [compost metagenome]
MKLDIVNATCGYNGTEIVRNITFSVRTGDMVCLLGPNGAGKTTLFKSILGFLPLIQGEILLDGQNMTSLPPRVLAKSVSYVPQAHTPPFAYKVLDVVLMGRTAHIGMLSSPSSKDKELAARMLDDLRISHLAGKDYTQISGGERQLVLIARALAQEPKLLIMDEPTANLDFGNQVRVLEEVQRLSRKGLGILMTSHSPDHAFLCSTKVALMISNQGFLFGEAADVVTEQNLKAAYGVEVRLTEVKDSLGRTIQTCVPLLNQSI